MLSSKLKVIGIQVLIPTPRSQGTLQNWSLAIWRLLGKDIIILSPTRIHSPIRPSPSDLKSLLSPEEMSGDLGRQEGWAAARRTCTAATCFGEGPAGCPRRFSSAGGTDSSGPAVSLLVQTDVVLLGKSRHKPALVLRAQPTARAFINNVQQKAPQKLEGWGKEVTSKVRSQPQACWLCTGQDEKLANNGDAGIKSTFIEL